MQASDLRPARDFAQRFGCKTLIFGPPGTAKTPGINNAPRPVLLACEPGLLSMRGSNVPTWCGFTPDKVDEFFKWLFNSKESSYFDTVGIDSSSQMADIYLQSALGKKSASGSKQHGLAAYGEMAGKTMEHLRTLYYMPQKHTYVIAKQVIEEGFSKPYFPGQVLPIEVPHLYDFILHLNVQNVPGVGQVRAFRCNGALDVMARNRTGNLNDFEPPNIGQLYQKAMT